MSHAAFLKGHGSLGAFCKAQGFPSRAGRGCPGRRVPGRARVQQDAGLERQRARDVESSRAAAAAPVLLVELAGSVALGWCLWEKISSFFLDLTRSKALPFTFPVGFGGMPCRRPAFPSAPFPPGVEASAGARLTFPRCTYVGAISVHSFIPDKPARCWDRAPGLAPWLLLPQRLLPAGGGEREQPFPGGTALGTKAASCSAWCRGSRTKGSRSPALFSFCPLARLSFLPLLDGEFSSSFSAFNVSVLHQGGSN